MYFETNIFLFQFRVVLQKGRIQQHMKIDTKVHFYFKQLAPKFHFGNSKMGNVNFCGGKKD